MIIRSGTECLGKLIIDFDKMTPDERKFVSLCYDGHACYIDGPIPPIAVSREWIADEVREGT